MPERDLSSLSNVDPERLSRLWPAANRQCCRNPDVGDHAAPVDRPQSARVQWDPAELGDVLRHQLQAPLDLGDRDNERELQIPACAASPNASPARSPSETRPAPTLAALLSDPAPPVESLRRVKEWAKPAMQGCADDLPREVAGVIYFAAIHAALARSGQRITHLPDGSLRKGARWALRRPWLDPICVALFRDGLAHLSAGMIGADEA